MREENKEYKIVSELGSGGMATVYKAIQKSLDRPVAVKELKKAYHADAQIVQRFEREARMSASFQHENIVHIYDYWGKPDYCIVMEYVDGTDLAEIIEKAGQLPVDVGVMIALQVCSALDYAHMRGLIHRDIKPSNVMVKRNGEVKLMDFGIAHTKALKTLTQPGTFLGTPAYMSPEQILGQPLENRSDVFSFGIVLYEMFTGIKPFQDEETHSVSSKILNGSFLSPRSLNSEIPRRLQRAIKKCLKKKPLKRYESMQEVAKNLGKSIAGRTNKSASLKRISDYLVEAKIFDAPSESETVVITSEIPGRRLYRNILYGSAVALVLLIGSVAYYWNKSKQTIAPPPPAAPAEPGEVSTPTTTAQSLTTSTQAVTEQKEKRAAPETRKSSQRTKTKKKKTTHAR